MCFFYNNDVEQNYTTPVQRMCTDAVQKQNSTMNNQKS